MNEPSQESLADRLRAERERLGRSQQFCADLAEVGLSTWKRWEQGGPIPSAKFNALSDQGFDIYFLVTGLRVAGQNGAAERWPTGPTLEEYPVYGEVVKTLAHARGLPQTVEELDQFSRLALGIFLRAVRISDHNARQAEIRELVLLLTQTSDSSE